MNGERDEIQSCDKLDHAFRSLANQPNHLIFWRKLFHQATTSERIELLYQLAPELIDAAEKGTLLDEGDFLPIDNDHQT